MREKFDLIVADPPYLSEDCLTKTSITVRFISKNESKVLLCTGAIMENLANRLLNVSKTNLNIKHNKQLSNPFCSYSNYDLKTLSW